MLCCRCLQPSLNVLTQQVTEKCRQREDEVTKMKEAVEQSCEVIADCRDECTTLTNAITNIDSKLEQTKQARVSVCELFVLVTVIR